MISQSEKQIRYLSQAIQLEEFGNPALLKITLMSICVCILSFTVWAGFTNINEVARTPGEIVPDGYQRVVQHLDGGSVSSISVSEGDIVKKDDVLLVFDASGLREDLERARAKKTALSVQEERLRAYLENRNPDFSKFVQSEAEMDDQKNFFESMENTNREERKIIADQIEQRSRAIKTFETELKTIEENLAIANRLYENRRQLHEKGYLSETKFLESRQAVNSLRGDMNVTKNKIAQSVSELDEFKKRLSSLSYSQTDEVREKLDAVLAEKAQHDEIVRKIEDKYARLTVRAPVDGIIKGLSVNTIGAVARPGETLMEIVPLGGVLVAQVKIPPQHIGHVRDGQKVKIKFSNYDFSRYGLLDGTLQQVSATTFSGENGERYYQGEIRLDENHVGKGEQKPILPGMTLMAEIITGEKTILQYLLKPVHNSLKTAFSER